MQVRAIFVSLFSLLSNISAHQAVNPGHFDPRWRKDADGDWRWGTVYFLTSYKSLD